MKQGYDIRKLDKIISDLVNEIPLPPLNRDHDLIGDYVGCRECHIQGDWLLIYKYKDDTVIFLRTGSHSELF
jgi:mRNA interferase YafQ